MRQTTRSSVLSSQIFNLPLYVQAFETKKLQPEYHFRHRNKVWITKAAEWRILAMRSCWNRG
jgi:hypothetical protein